MYLFLILEVLHFRNIQSKLNGINFQTSANVPHVFSNWLYLLKQI